MSTRLEGHWDGTELIDMLGLEFNLGDRVVRAYTSGRAVNLEVLSVTQIKNGKLYLGDSKVPVNYPGRLLIINELVPPDPK